MSMPCIESEYYGWPNWDKAPPEIDESGVVYPWEAWVLKYFWGGILHDLFYFFLLVLDILVDLLFIRCIFTLS